MTESDHLKVAAMVTAYFNDSEVPDVEKRLTALRLLRLMIPAEIAQKSPGPPVGLCPDCSKSYGEDADVGDLPHEACRLAARAHDDQLQAFAIDLMPEEGEKR
jgi:hypothetical protein